MIRYKQPVSVLVVIYSCAGKELQENPGTGAQVLLLERADYQGYWQSVTGSLEPDETLQDAAVREVREETGLDARTFSLTDWRIRNVYEIYPQWRYRYPPGVTHNTEYVFGLQLPQAVPVQLDAREHLNFQWLPWQDAAAKVFSPSNRSAILHLAERGCSDTESAE